MTPANPAPTQSAPSALNPPAPPQSAKPSSLLRPYPKHHKRGATRHLFPFGNKLLRSFVLLAVGNLKVHTPTNHRPKPARQNSGLHNETARAKRFPWPKRKKQRKKEKTASRLYIRKLLLTEVPQPNFFPFLAQEVLGKDRDFSAAAGSIDHQVGHS